MAVTYERVLDVIGKPPDRRKDFEVSNLLSWFRKKSQLFASLKMELLVDIIKNLQFITKVPDELIIRQGEKGDCMYILLRGKVTIYIWYNKSDAVEDDQTDGVVPIANSGGVVQRQQLGTYVTSLGPGATFGEVALRQEDDCIRTASIIADETCDLIVVDRELYNRSVKYVLKKEFDDKLAFVDTHPFLCGWAPKYRKQLAMALEKYVYPYESHITKQADHVDAIYFVLNGEVKLTVDKEILKTQYPKYFSIEDGRPLWQDESDNDGNNTESSGTEIRNVKTGLAGGNKGKPRTKQNKKKSTVDVCLIGTNEPVGDLEILLNLDTYCQTALCTQKTDVLILERKHFDRLIAKRNPYTMDAMRENLELRLRLRMSRYMEWNVTLMKKLLQVVEAANEQKRQQLQQRRSGLSKSLPNNEQQLPPLLTNVTPSSMGDSEFIPCRGALVNMYGPGTVFHWIRKKAGNRKSPYGKSALGLSADSTSAPTSAVSTKRSEPFRPNATFTPKASAKGAANMPTEDQMTLIENRIHEWISNGTIQQGQAKARVAPLRRLVVRDVL